MFTEIVNAGENSLLLYFHEDSQVDPQQSLVQVIRCCCERLMREQKKSLIQLTPSYKSILVVYKIADYSPVLFDQIQTIAEQCCQQKIADNFGQKHCIPAYYDEQVAVDLLAVCQKKNIAKEQLIQLHSEREYTVHAVGFSPNFAYLGSLCERLSVARHATPRLHVAAGSVAIANQQTAVYPINTPGGWHTIARCPLDLSLTASKVQFTIADTVIFEPINKQQFLALGGILACNKG